ncbi:MAG: DoxX family protein [Bauldia sp.]
MALLLGRLMIAALFIFDSTIMARGLDNTAAMISSVGLPYPSYLAIAAAVGQFAGGIMVAVGLWTRLAALLFAIFCAATLVLFHHNLTTNAETIQTLKDLAIAGGFLFLFASGPGRWSMDARRRSDV